MSPEFIKMKSYSFPSDVWSFGCTIYLLLTFAIPYNGNIFQILKQIKKSKPGLINDQYSENLRAIIAKMIERSPNSRIKPEEILLLLNSKPETSNIPIATNFILNQTIQHPKPIIQTSPNPLLNQTSQHPHLFS